MKHSTILNRYLLTHFTKYDRGLILIYIREISYIPFKRVLRVEILFRLQSILKF